MPPIKLFFIYGVLGSLSRVAGILLIPLYTRTLSIEDYGALDVLISLNALFVILAGLQTESAVMREYQDARTRGLIPALVWSAVQVTVAGVVLLALGLIALVMTGVSLPSMDAETIGYLMVLTLLTQLMGVQMVFLRFSGRPIAFAILSMVDILLAAGFSLVFVVMLDLGVVGALMGLVCGKLVLVAGFWGITFKWMPTPFVDRSMIRRLVLFGAPSVPAVVAGWFQNVGNRPLLAVTLPLVDVALTGVAVKVAAVYGIVVFSFRLAWEPFAIGRLDEPEETRGVFNHTVELYVATMFPIAGFAALVAPYMVRILAPASFATASELSVPFILGQFWLGLANMLSIGVLGARIPSRLIVIQMAGVAVSVALIFGLAKLIGPVAAGIGFLLGNMAMAIVAKYYSDKYYATRFNASLLASAAIGSLFLSLGGHWLLAEGRSYFMAFGSSTLILTLGGAVVLVITFAILLIGVGRAGVSRIATEASEKMQMLRSPR
jgi:O-antigen/teichoic acid export membrane protein